MNKNEMMSFLNEKIYEIDSLLNKEKYGKEFKKWRLETETIVRNFYGEDSIQLKKFNDLWRCKSIVTESTDFQKIYLDSLDNAKITLETFVKELKLFDFKTKNKPAHINNDSNYNTHAAFTAILIATYSGLVAMLPESFGEFRLDAIRIGLISLALIWFVSIILGRFLLDKTFSSSKLKKYYSNWVSICNLVTIAIFAFFVASYVTYILNSELPFLIIIIILIILWIKKIKDGE